jgi:hypothetical protein
MLKLKRNHITVKKMSKADLPEENYVKASPKERVSFIWTLTAEVWSLKEPRSAERRLQRHIANLVKQES